MSDVDSTVGLIRAVVAAARDEGVTFLAAAVAYYAFVSVVPLALLSVAVATAVGGEEFADSVVAGLDKFLTAEAQNLVREGLTAEGGRGSATVVGFVVVLWGGLKVFRGLDRAFSAVYGTTTQSTFVDDLRDATIALVAIDVGVLSVGVVASLFQRVFPFLPNVVGTGVLLVTLVVALFPLYYLFPDEPITPREALPGTVFTAGGWTLLENGFVAYVEVVGGSSVYGLLGGALLLVTWLYFGAILIILGAVINATLSGRRPDPTTDRQLQHPGPRQVPPEPMPEGDDTDADEGADPGEGDPTGVSRSSRDADRGEGDLDRTEDGESRNSSGGPPVPDGGTPSGEDGDRDSGGDDEPEPGEDHERNSGDDGEDGDTRGDDGDDERGPGDGDADGGGGPEDAGDAEGDGDDGRAEDEPDWPGAPFEDRGSGDPRSGDDGRTGGDDGADNNGRAEGDDRAGGDEGEEGSDGDGGSSTADGGTDDDGRSADEDRGARLSDDDGVRTELDRLWDELEGLETRVDDKTVSRSSLEAALRAYVRSRLRRGHARGWGPYLVLLYGTAMTLGAFYYLNGVWAVLAMIVLWLSTLGLYTLMIIVGIGFNLLGFLGKARGLAGKVRSEE